MFESSGNTSVSFSLLAPASKDCSMTMSTINNGSKEQNKQVKSFDNGTEAGEDRVIVSMCDTVSADKADPENASIHSSATHNSSHHPHSSSSRSRKKPFARRLWSYLKHAWTGVMHGSKGIPVNYHFSHHLTMQSQTYHQSTLHSFLHIQ